MLNIFKYKKLYKELLLDFNTLGDKCAELERLNKNLKIAVSTAKRHSQNFKSQIEILENEIVKLKEKKNVKNSSKKKTI